MNNIIAGVDEVGRGALCGNVVAAAVILPAKAQLTGLKDSKKLTPARREALYRQIIKTALAVRWAQAGPALIDDINIHHATLYAMRLAITSLPMTIDLALIDGKFIPEKLPCAARAVVGGDNLHACIAAASIVAKVVRDRQLQLLAKIYTNYDFEKNKGYPTAAHKKALQLYGASPVHRRSYAPVAAALR